MKTLLWHSFKSLLSRWGHYLSETHLSWYDSVAMAYEHYPVSGNYIAWTLHELTWRNQECSNTSTAVGMKCFSYPDVHGSSSDELQLLSSSESTIFLYSVLWCSFVRAFSLWSSSHSIDELLSPTIGVFSCSTLLCFNTTSNMMIFGSDSLEGLQIHVIGSRLCRLLKQNPSMKLHNGACSGIFWNSTFIALIMFICMRKMLTWQFASLKMWLFLGSGIFSQ